MAKTNMVTIRCQAAPGFDGVFRAGRKWPAAGLVVELLDQEKDREEGNGEVMGVGAVTMAALRGDWRFSIMADGALDELVALRSQVAELGPAAGEVEGLRKQVGELTAKVADLEAQLAEANKGKGPKGK